MRKLAARIFGYYEADLRDSGCVRGVAMIERLQQWAAQRGYRVAWGSGSIVERAQHEMAARKSRSEIDGRFFEHELKSIVGGEHAASGTSMLIVAMPRPAHTVYFDVDGTDFATLLPPTYFRYRATFEDVRMDLAKNGIPGVRLDYLDAPLKATAGHLGLIRYGRNNIGYVEDLGSYIQLCGYWVDVSLPPTEGTKPVSLLKQCENCSMCASVCPTDAIAENRVLMRAERCLTYLNENPGDWPDWVSRQAHNCLLGCLECQRACPANPELRVEDTGLSFSAAETHRLLSPESIADERAETGIRAKLAWLGQPYVESVLGRNLRALLKPPKRFQSASFP
jgi:epoxyqueuosine reductase